MNKIIPFLIVLVSFNVTAQNPRTLMPLGSWQYHLPLHIGVDVAQTDSKVYCAAKAGLFYYDKELNSTTQVTKEDGLSEIEISTIKYYKPLDMLLIAYTNTNIDIIQGNTIINLNDIERKQIIGEKSINSIHFKDDFAYLACSFGVVVLDLNKLEVKETYQSLGLNGEQLRVNGLCFQNSDIFLATQEGVLFAELSSSVNLLDFNNWNRFELKDSLPNLECNAIASFNENIYAYYGDTLDSSTYQWSNNVWKLDLRFQQPITRFTSEEKLIAVSGNRGIVLDKNNVLIPFENEFGILSNVINNDKLDGYWASDLIVGLKKITTNGTEIIKPNSPSNSEIFALEYLDNNIVALRGGYNASKTGLGSAMQIDVLGEYGWGTKTYQYDSNATLYKMKDVVVSKYNVVTRKTYYGSFGYGLIEEHESEKYTIYNDTTSPLVNTLESGNFTRVTDLAIDKKGTVWITNYIGSKTSSPSVHALKADGTWEGFVFSDIAGASYPMRIIVDKKDQKWVTLNERFGGGILVFDKSNENRRLLSSVFEHGLLPNNDVRCIVEDEKGEIWVGTSNGVAVFNLPDLMFDKDIELENLDARTPLFEGRPLLEEELVSCISVDKGNRKWIGTSRGVWLFNESGTEAIYNFTKENSPLPSNNILDIEIQHETGEVFISTSLGLVSYRGVATTGYSECLDKVSVFPNPVAPDYNGAIGISGLTGNTTIKILDMAGNLTFETQTYGGGASWNAKTFHGERVASGIYQILVIGNNRKNSCITRVAIVN